MNYFSFNGVSCRDHGLYITGSPYGSAEKDVEVIEIPGRSGDLTISNKRFKNQQIPYEVFIRNKLAIRARNIKAWLLSPDGYKVLEDTYDRDYFRLAFYTGPLDIAQTLQIVGQAEIVFSCKPFLYSKRGREVRTFMAPGVLINPESQASEPHIKIYGSGQGSLIVNNQTVIFSAIDSYVEIDTEMGQAYNGTVNKSPTMTGDFPTLLPGVNNISWDGGITQIEITPRWCTL